MTIPIYNLKNRCALITGGTHGIGLAICKQLANYGCKIAFLSRSSDKLKSTSEFLDKMKVDYLSFQADVLCEKDCTEVMDKIEEKWGRLDILINNVGGGGRWGQDNVEETDPEVWKEVHQKNTGASILFTMKTIPLMRKNKWGRVITITSIYGKEGGGRPWFNMAKSAQVSLMKSLSLKNYLVRDGLTFNSVAPGGIYIEGTGSEDHKLSDPDGFHKMIDKEYPMGRMGSPDEVANVVSFLCSDFSSLINGAQIPVDGGQSRSF